LTTLELIQFKSTKSLSNPMRGLSRKPCSIKTLKVSNREVFLEIPLKKGIQDFVRWQRVLVYLAGPKLGRRRLGDGTLGDHASSSAINFSSQRIDPRLKQIP
jgi:hypothetical protein